MNIPGCENGIGSDACPVTNEIDFLPNEINSSTHADEMILGILAVARKTRIISLNVGTNTRGVLSSIAIIEALNWLVENKNTYPVSSVSMSFSVSSLKVSQSCVTGPSAIYRMALAAVRDAKILPIAASGNSGFGTGTQSPGLPPPACDPDTLSVGAVYEDSFPNEYFQFPINDTETCRDDAPQRDHPACFSNTASFLDMLAPGVDIQLQPDILSFGTSIAGAITNGGAAIFNQMLVDKKDPDLLEAELLNGPKIFDGRVNTSFPRLSIYPSDQYYQDYLNKKTAYDLAQLEKKAATNKKKIAASLAIITNFLLEK